MEFEWDATGFDSELDMYYHYLESTDHIPNKIVEAQALGIEPNDYTEVLEKRADARRHINELINK